MRRRALVVLSIVFLAGLLASSCGIGFLAGRGTLALPIRNPAADPSLDLTVFWEAWNFLKAEYYRRPLDQRELVRGAVRGLFEATGDANTGYIGPESFELAQEDLSGAFEGIGAEVGVRDERVTIIAPLPGSPAERAGLRPGDVITKIDGQDATKLGLIEAVTKVRGQKGTTVRLTVERPRDPSSLDAPSRTALLEALPVLESALRSNDAERARQAAASVNDALRRLAGATVELEFAIVRERIERTVVEARALGDGVAYLKFGQFSRGISEKVDVALQDLMKDRPRALVLDLRRNSGGYVDEAVAVASQFLPQGRVVFVEERVGDRRREFTARGGGRATDIPMVVLVDRGTASAGEILAGALRDHGRAQVVGITTFGKGTEQLWHQLSDGSGVRITVARWLTPKGAWVQEEGLRPDAVVEDPDPAPPDLQLDRAVALLR